MGLHPLPAAGPGCSEVGPFPSNNHRCGWSCSPQLSSPLPPGHPARRECPPTVGVLSGPTHCRNRYLPAGFSGGRPPFFQRAPRAPAWVVVPYQVPLLTTMIPILTSSSGASQTACGSDHMSQPIHFCWEKNPACLLSFLKMWAWVMATLLSTPTATTPHQSCACMLVFGT